jgi:hypothetical protein
MPETPQTFDLSSLAEANYLRHRSKRYLAGLGGGLAFVAFLAIDFSGVRFAASPLPLSERYFFAAIGTLMGYLCLSLGWVPFRYWAPPPVAMSVSSEGLDFLLRTGRHIRVPWRREALRIELLERVVRSGKDQTGAYRIWVMWGRGDFELVWRRIVPLVYTTELGLQRVLEEATSQHLSVERFDPARSLSLVSTVSRTAYIISRERAGVNMASGHPGRPNFHGIAS